MRDVTATATATRYDASMTRRGRLADDEAPLSGVSDGVGPGLVGRKASTSK